MKQTTRRYNKFSGYSLEDCDCRYVCIMAANASGELSVLPMSKCLQGRNQKARRWERNKMEVKINREIRNLHGKYVFRTNASTVHFSVLACRVAVGVYFLLKPYVGTETVSWMCILAAAPLRRWASLSTTVTAEKFCGRGSRVNFLCRKARFPFHQHLLLS